MMVIDLTTNRTMWVGQCDFSRGFQDAAWLAPIEPRSQATPLISTTHTAQTMGSAKRLVRWAVRNCFQDYDLESGPCRSCSSQMGSDSCGVPGGRFSLYRTPRLGSVDVPTAPKRRQVRTHATVCGKTL